MTPQTLDYVTDVERKDTSENTATQASIVSSVNRTHITHQYAGLMQIS